jgi:hypothetical protein
VRIITVEEHFHHPEAVERVLELTGPGPIVPSLPRRAVSERTRHENRTPARTDEYIGATQSSVEESSGDLRRWNPNERCSRAKPL